MPNCLWDGYWAHAGQLLANFPPPPHPLSLVTVAGVCAKVNSAQFSSRFQSGELSATQRIIERGANVFHCPCLKRKGMLHGTIRNNDFWRNTALQHCCDIVSNGSNIVPTLQRCVP